MSRVQLAKATGIDSSRLTSYEHGRAATPFGVALRVAAITNVRLAWLATGDFPLYPYAEISPAFTALIPSATPFSRVFDRLIAKNWSATELKADAPLRTLDGANDFWERAGGSSLIASQLPLLETLIQKGKALPFSLRIKFIEALIQAGGLFFVLHEKEIARFANTPPQTFLTQQKVIAQYIRRALQ